VGRGLQEVDHGQAGGVLQEAELFDGRGHFELSPHDGQRDESSSPGAYTMKAGRRRRMTSTRMEWAWARSSKMYQTWKASMMTTARTLSTRTEVSQHLSSTIIDYYYTSRLSRQHTSLTPHLEHSLNLSGFVRCRKRAMLSFTRLCAPPTADSTSCSR
jgi:hypothetical protein